MSNEIVVTIRNGLQIIKLNRPNKKNAITSAMYSKIIEALKQGANDDNVAITALTGEGDYYSSGRDISAFLKSSGNKAEAIEPSILLNKFVSAFIDYPKILVGVVNGPAIGIAVTTLGLCDVLYASHRATFKTPFTVLGLSAEGCSSYTFPKIMGTSMASEMLYFNREIDAYEAKAFGFVSEIFPHAQLNDKVWPRLEAFAKLPVRSMIYSKILVRRWNATELHKACDEECERLTERCCHEDSKNAVLAIFKKISKI